MSVVIDGTLGVTTPAETVSGTGVWSVGGTQIYKDASGNVGIGTTGNLNYSARLKVLAPSNQQVAEFYGSGTNYQSKLSLSNDFSSAAIGSLQGNLLFYANDATTERARIDSSGNLLVGTTSSGSPNPGISLSPGFNAQITIGHDTGSGSGQYYIPFKYNAGLIGGITQNGTTAVAYNTTSDYRLKENVQPLSGALERIAALKPVTYTWKAAPDEVGEGFIAHELAEVCPQATTGEKDAVDADGNPVYQGIDTSFLVATLTAAIQEQQAIIEQLRADVAELKAK